MTRAKPTYIPPPRILNATQVAARLGMSASNFHNKRAAYEAAGFPRYDDLLRGWDGNAIERWLDNRSGIDPSSSAPGDRLMEKIRGGGKNEIRQAG